MVNKEYRNLETNKNKQTEKLFFSGKLFINNFMKQSLHRRKCQGEFMDGRSRMDVTQSESDLPDFNQSEH